MEVILKTEVKIKGNVSIELENEIRSLPSYCFYAGNIFTLHFTETEFNVFVKKYIEIIEQIELKLHIEHHKEDNLAITGFHSTLHDAHLHCAENKRTIIVCGAEPEKEISFLKQSVDLNTLVLEQTINMDKAIRELDRNLLKNVKKKNGKYNVPRNYNNKLKMKLR